MKDDHADYLITVSATLNKKIEEIHAVHYDNEKIDLPIVVKVNVKDKGSKLTFEIIKALVEYINKIQGEK